MYEEVDYGKNKKVLIFEEEILYIEKEIKILQENKWIDKIIFAPQEKKEIININTQDINIYYFFNEEELKNMIKSRYYQIALILYQKNQIIQYLKKDTLQNTLFDNINTNGAL
jgi:hypothetical protein